MASTLQNWLEQEVAPVRGESIKWLSERHFFRDPIRPVYSDPQFFFSPADGIVIYQSTVAPDEALVEIKGQHYSLREALRDDQFAHTCMVVGIFMTFYDVHINRLPYAGRLSYKALEPLDSLNYPMLAIEKGLISDLNIDIDQAAYLHNNQRMVNRIYAPALGQWYYVLQIADYDVDSIMPFSLKQNHPLGQNQRFSQIRYGSQVDLIVPLSKRHDFSFVQQTGVHIEAGIDALIKIS